MIKSSMIMTLTFFFSGMWSLTRPASSIALRTFIFELRLIPYLRHMWLVKGIAPDLLLRLLKPQSPSLWAILHRIMPITTAIGETKPAFCIQPSGMGPRINDLYRLGNFLTEGCSTSTYLEVESSPAVQDSVPSRFWQWPDNSYCLVSTLPLPDG